MKRIAVIFSTLLMACSLSVGRMAAGEPIKILIIDGQNNHQWAVTTPMLQKILENTGRFSVDVQTTPESGHDMSAFRPKFQKYDVVLSNYNGDAWPASTQKEFEHYVRTGGGFVPYHAADNAFPEWPEYNKMIGLGGWGGRTEKDGPYLRLRDGKFVPDMTPGKGGSHGKRHPYAIDNRAPDHPIMQGLPSRWLHSIDELYDRMRGPAENLEVLASAYSDKSTGGSGEHEPLLMTIQYGSGRIFHTGLGDGIRPLFNVGFQVTLARGTEWAATGKVTLPVPAYFPSEKEATTADPSTPYLKDGVGWYALFNGKDLNGWRQVNGTAEYKVLRDVAEIVGTTAEGSPNSFLSTEKPYDDFELRFEVMLDNPELNSGVQIRSDQYEQDREVEIEGQAIRQRKDRVYGYQVEIEASRDKDNDNPEYGEAGFVYDEARRGWLSTDEIRADPAKRKAFINGQWNQYHIRCVGSHIQTWVNGILIADLHDELTATGHIMLQVHSIPKDKGPWSVRWRNILIRPVSQ